MRTTLSTMTSKTVNNLSRLTTDLNQINDQISSGLQMSRLSDKPTNLVSALGFRTTIVEIEQYTENIEHGNNIITASESAYTQIKDMTLTAKTLATQAINGTLGQENNNAIAAQVGNLYDQSVSLANTQNNGKYIFGGFRTTGYTDVEPEPFMVDKGDGHWINGTSFSNSQSGEPLTGAIASSAPPLQDITTGDLLINDTPITADMTTTPPVISNGLNMDGADRLKTAINNQSGTTSVSASLTTLHAGNATQAGAAAPINFSINGTPIVTTGGVNANATAQNVVDAIKALDGQTGVSARIGDGTNGGTNGSVVLYNTTKGNENDIIVADLSGAEATLTGLTDGSYSVAANANTGEISLSSPETYILTSPNHNDDTILNVLGLGGGGLGFVDDAGDGTLISGPRLGTDDLIINGISVPAPVTDGGLSDVFTDASAAAKAEAINSIAPQTGVTAQAIPINQTSQGVVLAGTIGNGDLIINGFNIFDIPTTIISQDKDSAFIDAINSKTAQTGIKATIDADGYVILTAQDGRNLHVETSSQGVSIVDFNGGGDRDSVYFGTLQLSSDRKFSMESSQGDTTNLYEPGFAAIGMSGGSSVTGEAGDIKGDGKIDVFSIHDQPDYIRYTGDRENNLEIKIGKTNTMKVGENGQDGLMDTGVFTALKNLENHLLGKNLTTVNGIHQATDTSIGLNSKTTGLETDSQLPDEDLFADGSFQVTVTDHYYYPARETVVTIGVDTAYDSLDSIANRIDGISNLSASWNSDGNLAITSDDPSRYTINLNNDSSNFLNATGTSFEFMQQQAISQALADLDEVMSNLTNQISDFGARANRIDIQANVYSSMIIATRENLSEVQDTDFTQAVMDLKAKEVAYQAALSAAAKTMQVSLVDFL